MKRQKNSWLGGFALWLTGLTAEAVISGAFRAPVVGGERLYKVDWKKPVMIVTTHLSDSDVQLAAYRLHKTAGVNLVVSNQSTQHEGKDLMSLGTTVFIKTLGRGKFSPMGWKWGKEGRPVPAFKPQDFLRIKHEVFGRNKTLLIAGHNPTFDGILPEKPGLGAAIAAEMVEGVQIVPVGVVVEGGAPNAYQLWRALSGRWARSAKVIVGEPFRLERKLDDMELKIILSEGDIRLEYREKMRNKASEIMYRLAQLLPEEKRGIWN